MKFQFLIERSNPRWREVVDRCCNTIREATSMGTDLSVKVGEPTRTLDQNAAMWPALRDIARQVPWQVVMPSGETRAADEDDWKAILTAAFERETAWTPGLRGGVVMLGARTSKYGKRKMGEFLSFVHAEGDDRGVVWSEAAKDNFDLYCPEYERERAA